MTTHADEPQPSAFMVEHLGDPSYFGASSWIEVFYFTGGAIAAVVAVIALRQSAKLSRASFFLTLYDHWNDLEGYRKAFSALYSRIEVSVRMEYHNLLEEECDNKIREECRRRMGELRASKEADDEQAYIALVKYFAFFETLGLYVRKRFISLSVVDSLYRHPILTAGNLFEEHVSDWQKEAGLPPGLFENALFLIRRTRRREHIRKLLRFWK